MGKEKKKNKEWEKQWFLELCPWVKKSTASLVVLIVKTLPAKARYVRGVGVIPGWEDPLEKGMAILSSILTWRILWTQELGGLQSMGSQRVEHEWKDLVCMHRKVDGIQWTRATEFEVLASLQKNLETKWQVKSEFI